MTAAHHKELPRATPYRSHTTLTIVTEFASLTIRCRSGGQQYSGAPSSMQRCTRCTT